MSNKPNNKTAADATNIHDGEESISKGSTTTAYLAYFPDNTSHDYGSWSGTSLPIKDHITVIIPMKDAQLMFADGSRRVQLNTACVEAQSKEVRQQREEEEAKARAKVRHILSTEIEEDFAEEIEELDNQLSAIYRKIEAQVDARLDAQGATKR